MFIVETSEPVFTLHTFSFYHIPFKDISSIKCIAADPTLKIKKRQRLQGPVKSLTDVVMQENIFGTEAKS